jgi:PPOX class probable F420-dependent enzyme
MRARAERKVRRMPMLTEEAERILRSKSFAFLALNEDGRPQVSPVWVDVDDQDRVTINTVEGRLKARLLDVGTAVALAAADPEDPYKYVQVRGRVVERTHKGADEHVDRLAKKYMGVDSYPFRQPGEQRVKVVIEPEHISQGI